MFITFEGGDGTGKSTQIALLQKFFEAQGKTVLVTREPGGDAVAEKIRKILLDKENKMDDLTEVYLYAAARAEHVRTVIEPALRRGEIVLCDRFLDSSLAYQGFGRGIGMKTVLQINAAAVGTCMPDRTYLLVLSSQDAEKRVDQRGEKDRLESVGKEFNRRVSEGFLALGELYPERIRLIDASGSIEQVSALIRADAAGLTQKG